MHGLVWRVGVLIGITWLALVLVVLNDMVAGRRVAVAFDPEFDRVPSKARRWPGWRRALVGLAAILVGPLVAPVYLGLALALVALRVGLNSYFSIRTMLGRRA